MFVYDKSLLGYHPFATDCLFIELRSAAPLMH